MFSQSDIQAKLGPDNPWFGLIEEAYRIPGREDVWITAFWESPDNAKVFEFHTSPSMYERFASQALSDEGDSELAEKAMAVAAIIESHGSG